MKKFIAKVMALAICITTLMSTTALASTADITFENRTALAVNTNWYQTSTGRKDNSSFVYVYLSKVEGNSTVRCRTMGATSSTASFGNYTYNGKYVILSQKTEYLIYNSIKETKRDYARLDFQSTGAARKISGKWSPDSIEEKGHTYVKVGQ